VSTDQLERNKELVRRAWAAYDRGDVDGFAACVTAEWVERDADGSMAQLADARKSMDLQRTAFPDKRTRIDQIIAEGDLVVTRTVTTATHRGEYLGLAPTGKVVTLHEMLINRIEGDRIAESWQLTSYGFYKQLTGKDAGSGDNMT
jgi:predicted ester cyclase